jgi:hypothetical protein
VTWESSSSAYKLTKVKTLSGKHGVLGLALLAGTLLSQGAHAQAAAAGGKKSGFVIDTGIHYLSRTLGVSSGSSTDARMYTTGFIGAAIPNVWFIGWDTAYFSTSTKAGSVTSSISGLKMGPRFGLYASKTRSLAFAATYQPYVRSTYKPTSGSYDWQGWGYSFELSYTPQVTKWLFMGIKILYDVTMYNSSEDSNSTISTISVTDTAIYPSFAASIRF